MAKRVNYPAYLAVLCDPTSYANGPIVLHGFTKNEATASRLLFYSYRTHLSAQKALSPALQEVLSYAKTITISITPEADGKSYFLSYCPVEYLNTGHHGVTLAGLAALGIATPRPTAPGLGTGVVEEEEEVPTPEGVDLEDTISKMFGQ